MQATKISNGTTSNKKYSKRLIKIGVVKIQQKRQQEKQLRSRHMQQTEVERKRRQDQDHERNRKEDQDHRKENGQSRKDPKSEKPK